ncbi:DUF1542 domain-containing protein [Streptococcus mitis]|uniref:DUF1542 domain-containing protein n=1 Tax=Streptococcus mitis TaxID=28037 RepID=UPI0021B8195E|nr:DUF1542 domain-containing protein [Streptococcus mitis]
MFINKKEKFSIRKFKDGRSDSVKIGTVGLIVGAALAMAGQPHIAEAAMTENSDNTTTISNDKGSVIVDTANIENPDAGRAFSTDPTAEGTNTITKTGKVDYKYVTAEGNTVLEENKNQNSGADKTIETPYDVYGKSGEVFKGTTGGDAEASDLNDAKENGKKETIEKDGKTYHLIGEPKVETTGNGGGVYSDTTLGDVTAKLTPEGLSNAEGKITYDTVKPGGKAWIVEQTGKGTYGKYVQADSGAITSDAKMIEAFKAGEATAKNFTSANVTADGGIKEGDYVFVLEKNTYVTAKTESFSLTAQIQLSSSDNVADDKDGTGATLNRTYAMVQNFKAAPDTLTGEANKTLVKNYLAYLQEKGFEDNLLNFKRYITLGMAAKTGGPLEISADKGDQVDDKGRPTSDITADIASVTDQETSTLEDSSDFLLKFSDPSPEVEEYSYRDEITPLRAYRLASGTTTITYTYAEEKTREIEKKGSVVVNYQTEDGTELKSPYTDTPETVAEVVTEKYYVDADGNDVIVSSTTASKNVPYNTKENETEKPQKLTDAQGNVYYLNEANTMTSVNGTETTSPAETGTVVEGVTKVTYIYEKAGSVIVNYKTEDGTPLAGTVVDEDGAGKTVESGAKDIDNGKPGTAYNTADNGMKPTRIKTAEGKVYELVPDLTEGEETGEVESGTTKEVTYVYKEVKGNVVVKYEDTEGNTLADDEKDETDASLNVKYDTADHKKESIEKDGVKYYLTAKELKDGSKPATGDVVEGTTTVTYVYEKAGSVIVNYQTEDGTPLTGTADGANVASGAKDTTDAKAGTDYNTADNGMKPNRITTAEGKVYELVPTATKGEETGKVVAGETKEVTYVYKEVKGNVVVKYEDTEGNVIAEDEKDETDASLNVKYDTADHKKAEITKDGVKYYLTAKELKDDSKPATGDVVEGTTTVTYVYEKAGQVVVNYQTEDGTPLVGVDPAGANVASGAKDTVDGKPGSDYDTSDNGMKPARITTAEGKVYELVPTATKGEETGKVVAGETKEVTYVYKEVTGDVVVHYVDTEGNKIAADKDDLKGASLSEKYDTAVDNKPATITTKDGKVYVLVPTATKGEESGKVTEGTTEVTYVYKDVKEEASKAIDKALSEKESKIKENPELTNEEKEKAIEDAKKSAEQAKKALEEAKTPEDVEKSTTKGKEDVEKTPVTPEDKPKAKEAIDKALENKVKKIDENPNLTPEQKEKAKEEAKKDAEEAKKAIDKAPSKEEVEKAKENGKKEVEKDTPTPDKPSTPSEDDKNQPTTPSPEDKAKAKEAIDKALENKVKKIDENPNLTPEQKEKAKEEAKKKAEEAKKTIDKAPSKEEVEKAKENGKKEVEKDTPTPDKPSTPSEDDKNQPTTPSPEDKAKAKEAIDKALENKVKKIDENPNLTPEQKEKAKEEAKKDAEEAKKAIDKAPSKEEVEKAKENGKKEVEKDTPTPDSPSNPSTDNPTNPSEGNKDKPYTPSPEEKAKAKESVDKDLEEKIKNIDKDPNLTPEQKEKAKEEAKKEAEKVKKSIEEGKTTEWVDEKGNPIKPVTPGTYPAGSTPNYELVGTVTNKETGKVTHIFKPSTKKPVTVWVDVNGKPVKPLAEGDNPAGEIPGYALVETIKDEKTGNVIHVFKRTTNGGSLTPSQPGSPSTSSTNPTSPVKPTDSSQPTTPANPATPTMPSAPVNGKAPQAPAASSEAKGQAELPNTGTEDHASLAALGLLGVLSGFGLVARKKKED